MHYEDLVGHFGGLSKAASALDLDRRAVNAWSKRRIPSKWQMKAEAITDGKLRADDEARAEATEMASYVAAQEKRVAA
jgi:hypothetical protein